MEKVFGLVDGKAIMTAENRKNSSSSEVLIVTKLDTEPWECSCTAVVSFLMFASNVGKSQ